jgi:hypothetical protein
MEKQADSPDFEIGDVENFQYNKDEVFSHQTLVMSTMKRVLEFGAHELVEGVMETNVDNKGNIKQVYREDTRKRFVESIKCCMMVMCCDFDTDAEKEIGNLIGEIGTKKKYWLEQEQGWFKKLSPIKQKEIQETEVTYFGVAFAKDSPYEKLFFEEELRIYREVFVQLTLLTKRLDFYTSEEIEA